MAVVLRCVVSPITLISAVRDVVATLDREQPIFDVETMERRLGDSIAEERADMTLLTGFGLIAMLLAVVGIYGVISFHVSQRTYEIGVRMALGAEKIQILQLVLRAGTILLIPGIAIGLGAAFVLTRFLSSMLFGIGANDLTSFIGAALVLASSAFLACYIPARRAAKVDPMVALRYE
jgi:putative ABC transport system permease protein